MRGIETAWDGLRIGANPQPVGHPKLAARA
jgi:hypothetical protein